jgi:hypothetical protein
MRKASMRSRPEKRDWPLRVPSSIHSGRASCLSSTGGEVFPRILLVRADAFALLSFASIPASYQRAPGNGTAPIGPAKEDYGSTEEMRECGLYLPSPRKREVLQRPLRGHREQNGDQLPVPPRGVRRQAGLSSEPAAHSNGGSSSCRQSGLNAQVGRAVFPCPKSRFGRPGGRGSWSPRSENPDLGHPIFQC